MLQLIGSTIESVISAFVNTFGILIAIGNGIGYALICLGGALFDAFKAISHGAVFVYDEFRMFVQDVDAEYTHIVKVFHNRLVNVVGDAVGAAHSVIGFIGWTFDSSKSLAYNAVHRWMDWFAWSAVTTRSVFVTIGNSTWLLIMLIPNIILFLTKKLVQILIDLLGGIASIVATAVSCVVDALCGTIDYFTAFPLHSVVGLFAIFLAIKYKHKALGVLLFGRRRLMMMLMYVLHRIGNVFLGIFMAVRFIYGIFSSALELRLHRRSHSNEAIDGNNRDIAADVVCSPLNKSNGNSNLCVICQDQPKSMVLLPCRHLCLCRNCTYHLQSYRTICPLCRERFCETIQVYV